MPPEIINLLSSSPVGPSPPASLCPASPARTNLAAPSRALDYHLDPFDLTPEPLKKTLTKSTTRTPNEPIVGTKRTVNGLSRKHDDFLFLSDDFDTTGDLDGTTSKKPRISPVTARNRKSEDTSLKRTKSAVVEAKNRESLYAGGMQRWNSAAEPIEHSSSPNNATITRNQKVVDEDLFDPFASPPKHQAINLTSKKSTVRSPFASSTRRSYNDGLTSGWEWPAEMSNELPQLSTSCLKNKQPSKESTFIDLPSDDPFETSLSKAQPKPSKPKVAWDPISSSMPDIGDVDDAFSSPPRRRVEKHAGTVSLDISIDSESDDLPELDDIDFSKVKSKKRSYSLSPAGKSKATKKSIAKKSAEREAEKKQKAEARETDKERKRIEKVRAKEQRAIEKEKEKALAEVNKLRTDKKVSTPEMIVDLPTTLNPGLKAQIEELLGDIDVQYESRHNPVENVVKWRRKVCSRFDDEMGHWEPIPMHIKNEGHIMVILQAAEFVKLVLGSEGQDLESHVLKMKMNFPPGTIIYLIEGLVPWMRKNKSVKNRQFEAAVRNANSNREASIPPPSQSRRRKNQPQEYIDEDLVEDALLSLQVLHGALIHHTNAPVESAQWVAIFTQHISTIPYRKARDASADAGFCMESGQVRTGDGAKDTYIRMLQEITRVTAPIAYGVAAKYGTMTELVRGLEVEGPLALEDCRKSANKDGAFTDRTVGQAVSRRMHKIFLSRDASSTDV